MRSSAAARPASFSAYVKPCRGYYPAQLERATNSRAKCGRGRITITPRRFSVADTLTQSARTPRTGQPHIMRPSPRSILKPGMARSLQRRIARQRYCVPPPPMRRSRPRCLLCNFWLGRLDSNQGMAESKSAALPLGYAPSRRLAERGRTILRPASPINAFMVPPRRPAGSRRASARRPRSNTASRPSCAPPRPCGGAIRDRRRACAGHPPIPPALSARKPLTPCRTTCRLAPTGEAITGLPAAITCSSL